MDSLNLECVNLSFLEWQQHSSKETLEQYEVKGEGGKDLPPRLHIQLKQRKK